MIDPELTPYQGRSEDKFEAWAKIDGSWYVHGHPFANQKDAEDRLTRLRKNTLANATKTAVCRLIVSREFLDFE